MADTEPNLEDISSEEDNHDLDTQNSTVGRTGPTRKKPYHFRDTDDINLLREILVEKPIGKEGPKKWKSIFERLVIPVKDHRALKRRFDQLLKHYKSNNLTALRGSGLEENYDEKMQLLTEIISQLDDWQKEEDNLTASAKRKLDESQNRAQIIRDAALNNLNDPEPNSPGDSNDNQPTAKRIKKTKVVDILQILKSSEENDRLQKEEALNLEKKKLDLKQRQYELQVENDRHRRDMETRKLKMEERRFDVEQKRIDKDNEERSLLLQLLQKKL